MELAEIKIFKDLIIDLNKYSEHDWIFLPEDEDWNLESRCLVLEIEEVPQELEGDPKAGIPAIAIQLNMIDVMPIATFQEIVENIIEQNFKAKEDDILLAFKYYHEYDCFIDLLE